MGEGRDYEAFGLSGLLIEGQKKLAGFAIGSLGGEGESSREGSGAEVVSQDQIGGFDFGEVFGEGQGCFYLGGRVIAVGVIEESEGPNAIKGGPSREVGKGGFGIGDKSGNQVIGRFLVIGFGSPFDGAEEFRVGKVGRGCVKDSGEVGAVFCGFLVKEDEGFVRNSGMGQEGSGGQKRGEVWESCGNSQGSSLSLCATSGLGLFDEVAGCIIGDEGKIEGSQVGGDSVREGKHGGFFILEETGKRLGVWGRVGYLQEDSGLRVLLGGSFDIGVDSSGSIEFPFGGIGSGAVVNFERISSFGRDCKGEGAKNRLSVDISGEGKIIDKLWD